jgi:O-antigen/teichoic acid export membrane protein
MIKLRTKFRKRLSLVGSYSFQTMIIPLSNFIISFLVIRLKGIELWGEFVYFMIIISLTDFILAWGQREYLLREFSRNPSGISRDWQRSVINRLPLVIISLLFFFLLDFSTENKIIICFWLLSLFLYKSYDILVLYKKQFSFIIRLEIFSLILFIVLLFLSAEFLDLTVLLLIYTVTSLIKTSIVIYYYYREMFPWLYKKIDPAFLKISLPFFLPAFLGFIQSKTDLYCVAYFLSKKDVGEYQILITFLFYLQIFASLLITPFIKNIYRLPDVSLQKLMTMLFRTGVIISIPAIFLIRFVLSTYYQFEFSLDIYIIGYFYVIPFYLYLVKLYQFFKHNKQNTVVYITILVTCINLVLNIVLINKLGTKGALLASTISQWIMLGLLFMINKIPVQKKVVSMNLPLYEEIKTRNSTNQKY